MPLIELWTISPLWFVKTGLWSWSAKPTADHSGRGAVGYHTFRRYVE
jgi:hypothetical protein